MISAAKYSKTAAMYTLDPDDCLKLGKDDFRYLPILPHGKTSPERVDCDILLLKVRSVFPLLPILVPLTVYLFGFVSVLAYYSLSCSFYLLVSLVSIFSDVFFDLSSIF